MRASQSFHNCHQIFSERKKETKSLRLQIQSEHYLLSQPALPAAYPALQTLSTNPYQGHLTSQRRSKLMSPHQCSTSACIILHHKPRMAARDQSWSVTMAQASPV